MGQASQLQKRRAPKKGVKPIRRINVPAKIPESTVLELRIYRYATGDSQASIVDRAILTELERIRVAGGRTLANTIAGLRRTR